MADEQTQDLTALTEAVNTYIDFRYDPRQDATHVIGSLPDFVNLLETLEGNIWNLFNANGVDETVFKDIYCLFVHNFGRTTFPTQQESFLEGFRMMMTSDFLDEGVFRAIKDNYILATAYEVLFQSIHGDASLGKYERGFDDTTGGHRLAQKIINERDNRNLLSESFLGSIRRLVKDREYGEYVTTIFQQWGAIGEYEPHSHSALSRKRDADQILGNDIVNDYFSEDRGRDPLEVVLNANKDITLIQALTDIFRFKGWKDRKPIDSDLLDQGVYQGLYTRDDIGHISAYKCNEELLRELEKIYGKAGAIAYMIGIAEAVGKPEFLSPRRVNVDYKKV